MKKPGSTQYLRQLTDLILRYEEKFPASERKIELTDNDERKRDEYWQEILELSKQIRSDIGIPGKPVRKSSREPARGLENQS